MCTFGWTYEAKFCTMECSDACASGDEKTRIRVPGRKYCSEALATCHPASHENHFLIFCQRFFLRLDLAAGDALDASAASKCCCVLA